MAICLEDYYPPINWAKSSRVEYLVGRILHGDIACVAPNIERVAAAAAAHAAAAGYISSAGSSQVVDATAVARRGGKGERGGCVRWVLTALAHCSPPWPTARSGE